MIERSALTRIAGLGAVAAITLFASVPALGAVPFRNVVNEPFATVSNGPQGAIVIDESGMRPAGITDVKRAVQAQHSSANLRRAERTLRLLQSLGLKSPRARLAFPRRLVRVRDGQIVAPDLTTARQMHTAMGGPTNELRFTFEGFTEADRTALSAYLERALPVAYSVYGRPAFDLEVTITLDRELDAVQGGVYDSAANQIRLAPLSGNFVEDSYILLILVLQAFHDDAAFFYDVWEEGFAGAAATVIQTRPGVAPGYNPIDPGPFYATSVYEPQNQPDLGGPTFYPASGFSGMLVWRVAMARSAWFKCWVEDNNFFRNFNQTYYANFNDTLPGDVPRLRVLAASTLPSVEGMPFQEWFQRQWVFDTSVRIGPKLFVWNIPLTQSVALIAEHFYTTFEGDEQPRGGQARTTYWSYDFRVSLFAEEGNVISIPSSGEGAGEGFLIPTFFNIGGPQNITVQVDLGSLRLMLPFPYGERGFEAGENNLYGSVLGANTGTIDVQGGLGLSNVTVNRGVWGDRITAGDLSPQQLVVTFTNPQGQEVARVINVAWDSYVTFLHGGGQAVLTHTFSGAPPGLHLISFPLRPLTDDIAGLLGIPSDQLLLAYWDPVAPSDNKYQIWPRMEPIVPGKGYWLRVFSDVKLSLQGVLADETRPFTVPLKVGWNLIGSPRRDPVDVSALQFEAGGEAAVGYDKAVSARIIQDGVFAYSSAEDYVPADQMAPFEGYWIRCLRGGGALLRFPALDVAAAQTAAQSVARADHLSWKLPIIAEAAGRRSRGWIGASAQAAEGLDMLDLQAPPGFGGGVRLRFDPAGDGQSNYLSDIRPGGSRRAHTMRVTSTIAGAPVRVRWPDMSGVPDDLAPVLVDEARGRRLYMRTQAGYEIPATEQGVDSLLRIEVAPRNDTALVVGGVTAMQSRGAAAQLTFTLSAQADVEVTVLNIAGRAVCTVSMGSCTTGPNTLSWNLRDGRGHMVPNGLYLVRVLARDESGRQATGLTTLQIMR